MNRSDDEPTPRRGPAGDADRLLWRRAGTRDAAVDAEDWLLDLAAFAEDRLDEDERARIEALLAGDAGARADVAAARALAGRESGIAAADDPVVARAAALVPDCSNVIAFVRPARRRMLPEVARWSSVAAAMALASWLGFAMGSNASLHYTQLTQPSPDSAFSDLLDPSTGFLLHDLDEGGQT
jgi:hypothetical protein